MEKDIIFKKSLFGFKKQVVMDYILELQTENKHLREQLAKLEEKIDSLEKEALKAELLEEEAIELLEDVEEEKAEEKAEEPKEEEKEEEKETEPVTEEYVEEEVTVEEEEAVETEEKEEPGTDINELVASVEALKEMVNRLIDIEKMEDKTDDEKSQTVKVKIKPIN